MKAKCLSVSMRDICNKYASQLRKRQCLIAEEIENCSISISPCTMLTSSVINQPKSKWSWFVARDCGRSQGRACSLTSHRSACGYRKRNRPCYSHTLTFRPFWCMNGRNFRKWLNPERFFYTIDDCFFVPIALLLTCCIKGSVELSITAKHIILYNRKPWSARFCELFCGTQRAPFIKLMIAQWIVKACFLFNIVIEMLRTASQFNHCLLLSIYYVISSLLDIQHQPYMA